jgi:UDP-N-acetylglucosamine 1-carboxyvinyltransferase
MARTYSIQGGIRLEGEISVRGAKNAVTKEMVAALLAPGVSRLRNVPEIGDVDITRRVIESVGCRVTHDAAAGTLEIDATTLAGPEVPEEYSGLNRIPILLAGALLHRFGRAVIPAPGGCDIGARPRDFHQQGFEQRWGKVERRGGA